MILEEDAALFLHRGVEGGFKIRGVSNSTSPDLLSARFVDTWFKRLREQEAECATCPWQQICQGYFKWPDSTYDCGGVKGLFSAMDAVANEMGRELACRDRTGLEEAAGSFGSMATS
jgi:sulfatase maturation enzyme AslB (radical SAM superfamily)